MINQGNLKKIKSISVSLATASLCLMQSTPANSTEDSIKGQSAALGTHNMYNPKGVNLGAFRLFPRFVSENVYNDNIFYSDIIKKSDFIFHLRPSLELNSNWSKHALDMSVVSDVAYHATYSSEDWQDYFINLSGRLDIEGNSSGRYDLGRTSFATAKFYNGKLHETRGDPDGTGGRTPVTYFKTGGIAGYQRSFNHLRLKLSNETFHLDYEDGTSILNDTTIPNHLRNRLYNVTRLEAGYEINPDMQSFIRGSYDFTRYDNKSDIFGLDRSSTGYQIIAGIALDFTGKLMGDAYVGYLSRDYEDPQLQGLNDVTGGFSLTWFPTGLTTIKTRLDRIPLETTQGFASGSLKTSVKVEVNHELLRNLIISINGGYAVNEYTGSSSPTNSTPPRDDQYYTAGIKAKYLLNRNVYLESGYDYNGRSSNVNFNDFSINRVFLSIGLQI